MDEGRYLLAKLSEGYVGRDVSDKIANGQHAIATVFHVGMKSVGRFAGASVDDGYKVGRDHNAVLAIVHRVFANDLLFDDFHAFNDQLSVNLLWVLVCVWDVPGCATHRQAVG